ncbi:asparaginyl/glutamyl-tRNA amidotransferase subunit C [Tessaracoccus lapidicaptus]|uniref:Aspartyl/glutamyl-tRNA(Asn/Gln) amidotransferase subunit C n=1 Tax=Tessaracoccus lapidicaptus TaxID=1427523 RepID=A0A1C0ANC7_9ACTN|nr:MULTISPECIES: Asp-tRNA(Asn)/Glu-tRNA(Gln) amidotransferase subunit GatC [Tessaracoccus]AQX14701.1 asparaginyl/glutamyl-tRNA amidotransferase subunit C [Tessaracoccus sp. T2.5-30]OCL34640.1 asparaginyl/glutamyl-tRNA amidotransferase subunit C [Tessaracoccus lapidicaptus]VEP38774.1 Glutamyl-tRNA(Gln) amidotransferase subunit C [Tessaracoccus lapidicaptus]
MGITADDVARLGALARIRLTEQECHDLAPELNVILDSVRSVSEVAGPDVPMATHAIPLTNVFRDDVVTPSLTQDQALSGAPDQEDGRFRVPQILGEE